MTYTLISRYLDDVGDGSGVDNIVGNYASAADDFFIKPDPDDTYYITRVIISIEDTAGFRADRFGDLGAALTNGITIKHQDDAGDIVDFTDDIPIKTNAQIGALCYDVDLKTWGAGNELLLARFTFEKLGHPLRLSGGDGGKLTVTVNDDLTGLLSHRYMAQGYEDH